MFSPGLYCTVYSSFSILFPKLFRRHLLHDLSFYHHFEMLPNSYIKCLMCGIVFLDAIMFYKSVHLCPHEHHTTLL